MRGTMDYGISPTEREKWRENQASLCAKCGEEVSYNSKSGWCQDCYNRIIVPLRRKFAKQAQRWDAHYNELQTGLDALECPACGHEMRLWRVDGETMWSCMRRWREDGKLMMCSEVVEYEDAA